jgi:diguanylate cyclase (GGDEF)-like protein
MAIERADASGDGSGRIAGSVTAVILRCVERAAGDEAVPRLMAIAGDDRDPSELRQPSTWSDYETVVALFRAGIEVTGDPRFARVVGEEMLRQWQGSEVVALLQALGSPAEVLRNIAVTASKISTATRLEPVELGDDNAVVEAWAVAGLERDVTFCDYTAGTLSQVPIVFGMDPAEVVETQCQRLGAPRCVYEVRWDRTTSPDANPQRRIEHLEAQLSVLTERFESMQEATRELVATEGVETVLAKIVERASHAVRATRHLLAVSLGPDDLRVHHQGFASDDEARRVAREILVDEPDGTDTSRLVVEITAGDHVFGRLVALHPEGASFFPAERRLLEAFAATAAATLNMATALDSARRRNETARALLHLASALAEGGSVDAVAQRLADAVPAVIGTTHAAVLVWNTSLSTLSYRGLSGYTDEVERALRAVQLHPDTLPELARMLDAPAPAVFDLTTSSGLLRSLLHDVGVERVRVVPLVAGGEFYGVVTTPVADVDTHSHAHDDDLAERLQGMADQGAVALRSARLVDEIRYQALHDGLTGVANRRLLGDRLTRAVAGGENGANDAFALVFVDLDGFKQVNDTYGHATGDELLAVVARRLTGSVRATDTVARVGGDEFVALLTGVSEPGEARRVADHLLEVLRAPYQLDGVSLRVSASVGVVIGRAGDDAGSLLTSADAAMYHAKQTGRDHVELVA